MNVIVMTANIICFSSDIKLLKTFPVWSNDKIKNHISISMQILVVIFYYIFRGNFYISESTELCSWGGLPKLQLEVTAL